MLEIVGLSDVYKPPTSHGIVLKVDLVIVGLASSRCFMHPDSSRAFAGDHLQPARCMVEGTGCWEVPRTC